MKAVSTDRAFLKVRAVIILLPVMLACGAVAQAEPTAMPAPTLTATATLRPTSSPRPTATRTPTPAPVGVAVRSESYEVTVVDAVELDRIFPGGAYLYTPKRGYMIVDMGVHVKNLASSAASVFWNDVYVIEENGDSWYPVWASDKQVASGVGFNPFSLGIDDATVAGDAALILDDESYLRLVFIVGDKDPKTLLFGFDDSPLIEVVIGN